MAGTGRRREYREARPSAERSMSGHTWRGRRRGLSDGLLGSVIWSRASRSVGPLYQSRLVDRSIMLSPSNPEMGMKGIFSGLYPTFFRYRDTSFTISS